MKREPNSEGIERFLAKKRVVKKRPLTLAYGEFFKPGAAAPVGTNPGTVGIQQKQQRFDDAVHVIGRIGKGRAFREGPVEKASKAEIHKRNTPLLVHEDVCRSDIAVKHPARNTMGLVSISEAPMDAISSMEKTCPSQRRRCRDFPGHLDWTMP